MFSFTNAEIQIQKFENPHRLTSAPPCLWTLDFSCLEDGRVLQEGRDSLNQKLDPTVGSVALGDVSVQQAAR